MPKFFLLLATLCTLVAGVANAQTLRFDTNAGSFNLVLNPTNNAGLQPHVDNLLAYVGLGRYHFSAINRAPEDFVIQMGSFSGFPGSADTSIRPFGAIERFAPVVVDAGNDGTIDFDRSNLSNTTGTVSLALGGSSNSGTSSFFINLGDNSNLDVAPRTDDEGNRLFDSNGNPVIGPDFIPFAEIQAIESLDEIRSLEQADLGAQLGSPGSLAFIDIPLTDDGRFVVIQDVTVVDADANFSFVGPIQRALEIEQLATESAVSAIGASSVQSSGFAAGNTISGAGISTVPEPTSAALFLLGAIGVGCVRRR